jgi:hypothetical protein
MSYDLPLQSYTTFPGTFWLPLVQWRLHCDSDGILEVKKRLRKAWTVRRVAYHWQSGNVVWRCRTVKCKLRRTKAVLVYLMMLPHLHHYQNPINRTRNLANTNDIVENYMFLITFKTLPAACLDKGRNADPVWNPTYSARRTTTKQNVSTQIIRPD